MVDILPITNKWNLIFSISIKSEVSVYQARSITRTTANLKKTLAHTISILNDVFKIVKAVVNKMDVKCKCHGVSGSCEMRTCWRALPDFRSVGTQLRARFKDAAFVDYVQNRLVTKTQDVYATHQRSPAHMSYHRAPSMVDSNPSAGSSVSKTLSMPTENELIFTNQSPTYCHHEPQFGSIGTYGRRCSESSKGPESCKNLCCGREFRRDVYLQEEKCQCKFHWCCEVRCQICRKTVVISTCNWHIPLLINPFLLFIPAIFFIFRTHPLTTTSKCFKSTQDWRSFPLIPWWADYWDAL